MKPNLILHGNKKISGYYYYYYVTNSQPIISFFHGAPISNAFKAHMFQKITFRFSYIRMLTISMEYLLLGSTIKSHIEP